MSLKVVDVSKHYVVDNKNFEVVSHVSFEAQETEFVALIGPSGCGKSTLIRVMIGLEEASGGHVEFEGKRLVAGDGTSAMIFQHFALFPWMTTHDNIEFGLKMQGIDKAKRKKIVEDLVDEVGLSEFGEKHPKELSGGMRQRVGIARALAIDPKLLFCDEPFSALDAFTAETLRADLLSIWKKRKMTVVLVTHLVEEAVEMADKIVVMTPRPGKVEKVVENKLKRPRDKRSKEFFEKVDRLLELVKV